MRAMVLRTMAAATAGRCGVTAISMRLRRVVARLGSGFAEVAPRTIASTTMGGIGFLVALTGPRRARTAEPEPAVAAVEAVESALVSVD